MISPDDLRRLANFTGSSPEMMRVRLHEAADTIYTLSKRIDDLEIKAKRTLRFCLESEWVSCSYDGDYTTDEQCPSCGAEKEHRTYFPETPSLVLSTHKIGCELDALLTDLGFPTASNRDTARKGAR